MSDDKEESSIIFDWGDVLAGTASDETRERVRRQFEDPTSELRLFMSILRRKRGFLGTVLENKARREIEAKVRQEIDDGLEIVEGLATRRDIVDWLTGKELPEAVRRKIRIEVNSPSSHVCQVLEKLANDRGTSFYADSVSLLKRLIGKQPRPTPPLLEYNEDWFKGTRFAQH